MAKSKLELTVVRLAAQIAALRKQVAKASGGNTIITAAAYGATGRGVANDTAAINAALAAVEAQGGGTVTLDHPSVIAPVYRITGPVVIGKGVGLVAQNATIRCDTATACVQFGRWAGNRSYPTELKGITIDANNTGDPAGRLQIQAVQANISRVHVVNPHPTYLLTDAVAGDGVVFDQAQNLTIHSLDVDGFAGAALRMDNGAGGNSFRRCEIGTAGYSVLITDDLSVVNSGGYPFGPANNYWSDCIFENYFSDGGAALLRAEAGSFNVFKDCGFSVSTTSGTMSSGALIECDNTVYPSLATSLMIQGGNLNGGGHFGTVPPVIGVKVYGNNDCTVSANLYLQQLQYAFYQALDGAGRSFATMNMSAWLKAINVTHLFGKDSAADYYFWAATDRITRRVVLDSSVTSFNGFEVLQQGDAFPRFAIGRDGTLVIGDGTVYPSHGLARTSGDNGYQTAGPFKFGNSVARTHYDFYPSGAVTLDASQYSHYRLAVLGSGSVTSMTVTNAADGMELTVTYLWAASTSNSHAWASNMRFAGNSAPSPAITSAGTSVTFLYDSGPGLWFEKCRSVGYPVT